ncbi:uncharacterized protein LOC9309054 isoform X2 [Arabidopsis lyrata subsp. lyrata]|uniref:uncharacterized protein LOC9309054 isoform X2 n=1 Tax=Arabidopsis lyrata subsp. lyrata TaxID=81972 RepID=UPI000A29BD0C|nr:uncharacterized protein LOC9309054 isoform X2 [Arabidopsis lyrata subsp. lyrata]|eukprot:XP_020875803.1 uncharacterized protein LOC9309054 isoform X2 [Arabidopsis lyrata subsp. lyrata]
MKCSGRKALQPKNIFQTPKEDAFVVKAKAAELKENLIDASLAEELSAFKKKLERQREDRERTEKLLKERDGAMDVQMSLLLQRGETQKSLEIQVDRLFRLKELHAYSSISPIRSLRAKEHERMRRFSFAGDPEEEEESPVERKNLESIANGPMEQEENSTTKNNVEIILNTHIS